MKRHHKILVAGALVLLAGWLAWSVLLTKSEVTITEPPPPAQQAP